VVAREGRPERPRRHASHRSGVTTPAASRSRAIGAHERGELVRLFRSIPQSSSTRRVSLACLRRSASSVATKLMERRRRLRRVALQDVSVSLARRRPRPRSTRASALPAPTSGSPGGGSSGSAPSRACSSSCRSIQRDRRPGTRGGGPSDRPGRRTHRKRHSWLGCFPGARDVDKAFLATDKRELDPLGLAGDQTQVPLSRSEALGSPIPAHESQVG
jgi:hypothetical protein